MLKYPPLFINAKSIKQIAGSYYDILKKHAKIYFMMHDSEQRNKKLAKEFTAETREILGKIYQNLREQGIYITGIHDNGELKVSIVTTINPKIQIDVNKGNNSSPLRSKEALERIKQIRQTLQEI